MAELNTLLLEQVITDFTTNFDGRRQPWFGPKVVVSIEAADEFTIARIRRRVQRSLAPFLSEVAVTVTGGQAARTLHIDESGTPPAQDEWQ